MRWTVPIDRAAIADYQYRLEWALQAQNARFARSFAALKVPVVTVLAALGCALIALLLVFEPNSIERRPVFFVAALALFLVLPFIARASARKEAARKPELAYARVRASLARDAAAHYRKPAHDAPYTVEYTFDGERVRACAEKLGVDRELDLRAARRYLHATTVIYAFRFRWSFHPCRFIYVPGEGERGAILEALDRLGIPHEALTGPVEGYVAQIPEARAT